jgi:hypothetical protein
LTLASSKVCIVLHGTPCHPLHWGLLVLHVQPTCSNPSCSPLAIRNYVGKHVEVSWQPRREAPRGESREARRLNIKQGGIHSRPQRRHYDAALCTWSSAGRRACDEAAPGTLAAQQTASAPLRAWWWGHFQQQSHGSRQPGSCRNLCGQVRITWAMCRKKSRGTHQPPPHRPHAQEHRPLATIGWCFRELRGKMTAVAQHRPRRNDADREHAEPTLSAARVTRRAPRCRRPARVAKQSMRPARTSVQASSRLGRRTGKSEHNAAEQLTTAHAYHSARGWNPGTQAGGTTGRRVVVPQT